MYLPRGDSNLLRYQQSQIPPARPAPACPAQLAASSFPQANPVIPIFHVRTPILLASYDLRLYLGVLLTAARSKHVFYTES